MSISSLIDCFDVKYIIDVGASHLKICSSHKFDSIVIDLKKYVNIYPKDESYFHGLRNFLQTNTILQFYNRNIILIISHQYNEKVINELAHYLFDQHKIKSLYPLYNSVASLYPLGIDTSLVVDFGYQYTRVTPVFNYCPLDQTPNFSTKTASLQLFTHIRELMIERNKDFTFSTTLDENVFVNYICIFVFSAIDSNEKQLRTFVELCGVKYEQLLGKVVQDFLFGDTSDEDSIAKICLDSLLHCPIDVRKHLAANIVLMGGMAAIPDIHVMLMWNLEKHVQKYECYSSLRNLEFKCHPHVTSPQILPLSGGFSVSKIIKDEDYLSKNQFLDFIKSKYLFS